MWIQSLRSCSNTYRYGDDEMRIKEKNRKWITITVLALALCMMTAGIINGEPEIVLTKATSICLQCIGIN